MSDTSKLPIWFWVISIGALIWNLLGLGAFFSTVVFMSPETLATMSMHPEGNLMTVVPYGAAKSFCVCPMQLGNQGDAALTGACSMY